MYLSVPAEPRKILMAYEFHPDGRVVITTLEEALAWHKALRLAPPPAPPQSARSDSPQDFEDEPTRWRERFLSKFEAKDLAALRLVIERGSVRRIELKKFLEEQSTSLLRFTDRVKQRAEAAGFTADDVLERTENTVGVKKQVSFTPGRLLATLGI